MQALVHVDVEDLRAGLDLLARDGERAGIVAGGDQLAEPRRAGDVGALADVDEGNVGGQGERLEAGQAHQRRNVRDLARRNAAHRLGDRADVVGRRAAAAADDVDEAGAREFADLGRHRVGALVVDAEFVGQAGVRIGAGQRVGDGGDFGQMRAHRRRAERAVEPDREGPGMAHRMPERVGVWPDRVRPERSVMVPEIMIGRRRPRCRKSSSQAKIAALAFSVSKMVSIRMRSAPPSIRPDNCSP